MANICIIPARGGSKRIPRKNIRNFFGKPIIAYSIEAAISSGLFDTVMVSTDDQEIADISISLGAEVPFLRSNEASTDFATTFSVVSEVLYNYEKQGVKFEYSCCLYSCAPFVNAQKLEKSFSLLKENKFDSVFPIIQFGFPIQRALKIDNQNRASYFNPDFARFRSQDLERSFHDAGQFYWFNTNKSLEYGSIITNNSGSIIIPEIEGQDIDNETDWLLAELKFEILMRNNEKNI